MSKIKRGALAMLVLVAAAGCRPNITEPFPTHDGTEINDLDNEEGRQLQQDRQDQ